MCGPSEIVMKLQCRMLWAYHKHFKVTMPENHSEKRNIKLKNEDHGKQSILSLYIPQLPNEVAYARNISIK